MRRLTKLTALALMATLLPACAFLRGGKAKASKATRVKAATVRMEDGKQTLVVATAREDGALFFTRPPYEMNGSWRVEATSGIFDGRKLGAAGSTIFGIEADLLEGSNAPSEFYGVFARRFETPQRGLQVFASSEDGNHGQIFLSDATIVDLAIVNDGATTTFLARDGDAGGGYRTVGTRSMQSPDRPHYPGFGMFGAPKGAAIGFTNFRVPQNGPLPAGRPAATVALQALYDAAFLVLDAGYAVSGPAPDAGDAIDADKALAAAETALAAARRRIEEIEATPAKRGRRKTPSQIALKAVGKTEREITKARRSLDKKGARGGRKLLRSISKKLLREALAATDALLPDDVRVTLPGDGLPRK